MRFNKVVLAGLMALTVARAQAAQQNFDVKYRLAEFEGCRLTHRTQHQNYGFRMEIISDDDGVKQEIVDHGKTSVFASKDERYSIRLYNPLPVRVAVNLTVDGLNSITGKPSGITDGSKWIIEPYSSVTIPGWQINNGETRRFFFTEKHDSYAQWRGDTTGRDLAANCGVIGAAYFWSQSDLDQYYDEHPIYLYPPVNHLFYRGAKGIPEAPAPACASAQASEMKAKAEEDVAGTGMGERESHPTTEIDFRYDRGMYSPSQALVVYYQFAKPTGPNPFPAIDYAPEMP